MASSITIHVKILSGEMISVSFDPELGLSSIYQSIAKQMNCHSSQIHLFSLMHEKKEEEKSWIPSDNEIVGILIKDPVIEIESVCTGVFGTMWTHIRYKQYLFCVKIFENIYKKSFFYCPVNDTFHPTSSFYIMNPPNRGFLPGLKQKSDKMYHTFREFVEAMKVPELLIDSVTNMIEDRWQIIKFEK